MGKYSKCDLKTEKKKNFFFFFFFFFFFGGGGVGVLLKGRNIVGCENLLIFPQCSYPFPNKPWFLCGCSTSLEKTEGKGEIARNQHFLLLKTLWEKEKLLIASNFSFSHSVFYPF